MPSDIIEPTPGPHPHHHDGPGHPEPESPSPAWVDSSSGDELNIALTGSNPDPLLDEFVAETPRADDEYRPVPRHAFPETIHDAPSPTESYMPPPDIDRGIPTLVAIPTPEPDRPSADVIPPIDLTAPAPHPPATPDQDEEEDDDDEEDDPPSAGSRIGGLLLKSYASALTIGLLWMFWTGRHVREVEDADPLPAADARPDPGVRAKHSRKVVPKPPVDAKHRVALGKSVTLGLIEITPLGISSGPVLLERTFGDHERKPGGPDALRLRIRLRNVSPDTVLAPLDEAFLRDRPGADPDSEIEINGAETRRVIGMYPLALESEWGVVGQEFRDLKPGEGYETDVVSASGAADAASDALTWRLRLRTEINHTEDVGIPFTKREVRVGASKADVSK